MTRVSVFILNLYQGPESEGPLGIRGGQKEALYKAVPRGLLCGRQTLQ